MRAKMKNLHIYFHGNCFDGAVSAAIFTIFYKMVEDPFVKIKYFPLSHKANFSYDDFDFDGDVNVVLDFMFPPPEKVDYWFDHHQTTFLSKKDRKTFESLPRKTSFFWDPKAPSNASFMAEMFSKEYKFNLSALGKKLLEWADIIDAARFASPDVPVELVEFAPAFATLLERSQHIEDIETFIDDVVKGKSFSDMSREPYWSTKLNDIRQHNWNLIEDVKNSITMKHDVAFVDLSHQDCEGFNKFIPYYLFQNIYYSIALIKYPNKYKISIGANPFIEIPATIDIGSLCESYGGGGHYSVGGIALNVDDEEKAQKIAHEVTEKITSFIKKAVLDHKKHII
jgi:hypothetical protein